MPSKNDWCLHMQCATTVGDSASIHLVFSEDIRMGSGELKIATTGGTTLCTQTTFGVGSNSFACGSSNYNSGSDGDRCDVGSNSDCLVYVTGNILWASPAGFTVGETYTITIASGVVLDESGNIFTGLDPTDGGYSACNMEVVNTGAPTYAPTQPTAAPTQPSAAPTKAPTVTSSVTPFSCSADMPPIQLLKIDSVYEMRVLNVAGVVGGTDSTGSYIDSHAGAYSLDWQAANPTWDINAADISRKFHLPLRLFKSLCFANHTDYIVLHRLRPKGLRPCRQGSIDVLVAI